MIVHKFEENINHLTSQYRKQLKPYFLIFQNSYIYIPIYKNQLPKPQIDTNK